jgi:tRNA dimethylallyltransferase
MSSDFITADRTKQAGRTSVLAAEQLARQPIEYNTSMIGRIVTLVGPTAVGKTALAIAFAKLWERDARQSVEVVSADSRQVFRGLDVGTSKPTQAERAGVPHHLIDLVEPWDNFTLADFQDHAYATIDEILERGALPLVVGGTGLYVRAIVQGIQLSRVAPDADLRRELEEYAREAGADALHRRLVAVDPVAAGRIDSRNTRRVIRALEVTQLTGRAFSDGTRSEPRYTVRQIGLTLDREQLYQQIDERVDVQIAAGLLEETQSALDRGCPPTRPALSGFGYRQMVDVIAGRLALPEAIQRYKFETHRYARQQYSWFRLNDPAIAWLNAAEAPADDLGRLVHSFHLGGARPPVEAQA